jgi:sodium/hydrogen antiporter
MAEGLKLVDLEPDPHSTKIIAEVTLVWVLFADASRVRFAELREDLGHYVRLLAIGLPLTIGLGTLTAISVVDVSPWYALLLGAAFAPTDAALVLAMLINANGFVAPFVAGSAFGAVTARGEEKRSITSSRPAASHR